MSRCEHLLYFYCVRNVVCTWSHRNIDWFYDLQLVEKNGYYCSDSDQQCVIYLGTKVIALMSGVSAVNLLRNGELI